MLLLWLLVRRVLGQQAKSGKVRFVQESYSVMESNAVVFLGLQRVGGSKGTVRCNVTVLPNSTAELGADFDFAGSRAVEWGPGDNDVKAVAVRILNDDLFEISDDVYFSLDVDPPTARGATGFGAMLRIQGDGDAGKIFLDPVLKTLKESTQTDPRSLDASCIFWAERDSTIGSGRIALRVELSPCKNLEPDDEMATYGRDFAYYPMKRPVVWRSGELGRKCIVKELAWGEEETLNASMAGFQFWPDAEFERTEFVCFHPFIESASSVAGMDGSSRVQVMQEELRVQSQDLGSMGGGKLQCVRGHPCVLDVSQTFADVGDTGILRAGESCLSLTNQSDAVAEWQLPFEIVDRAIGFSAASSLVDLGDLLLDRDPVRASLCAKPERLRLSFGNDPIMIASMSLVGPNRKNYAECTKGAPTCIVTDFKGIGLSPGTDYLRVLENCQMPGMTDPGFLTGAKALMGLQGFQFDAANMSSAEPGIYRMCWCRPSTEQDCQNLSHYRVDSGSFIFRGPYMQGPRSVELGKKLVLSDVAGVLNSMNDPVRHQLRCGEDAGTPVEADVQSNGRTYVFGKLQKGQSLALQHQLCWCQINAGLDVFCNRSEDFAASFGIVNVRCFGREVDLNGDGSCELCQFIWEVPTPTRTRCRLDPARFGILMLAVSMMVLSFTVLLYQFEVSGLLKGKLRQITVHGRRIYIEDVYALASDKQVSKDFKQQERCVIITTVVPHKLTSCAAGIPVTLWGTGNFLLDSKPSKQKVFRAKVDGAHQLTLMGANHEPLNIEAESSMGVIVLPLFRSLAHTKLLDWLPAYVCVVLCLIGAVAVGIFLDMTDLQAGIWCLVSIVVAALLTASLKSSQSNGSLQASLQVYKKKLKVKNPRPVQCPKGPDRAVRVGDLFDLHDFFKAYVRDRTMYYMEPNILRPLTAVHKLSYAEVVGPVQVEWFVSHWWGTAYRTYCEALRRHAVSTVAKAAGEESISTLHSEQSDSWKATSYWICVFSNNQHNVEEELSGSFKDSPFYLALHSGICRGTCMILDESAMPLTRSWCLFELLQTIQLTELGAPEDQFGSEGATNQTSLGELPKEKPVFRGLMFCTETGVLNYGHAVVEMALRIGDRVSTLSVEGAQASKEADKKMINALVIEEMESFSKIDEKLRAYIKKALATCQDHVAKDFDLLDRKLAGSGEDIKVLNMERGSSVFL
eukprot:TRINITY_DN17433_c0_g1_i2.p1 TRINITY_DN17433_c0_g1~~TRINITY_DN17433_c0_g1_i2.p1  ORF type:complete len:1209 (-),score=208.00 TRINITY_DN17433_c0_g1_i2:54-3635(-)